MIELRFAEIKDALLLASLRIAMRKERETVSLSGSEEEFLAANVDYFRKSLSEGSYIGIIAEEDGKALANGGIVLHNHPPSYGVPNGKSACLLNMYTLPEARGRGLAGKILALLVERAEKEECCKVFLNASSMGKPLYVKFGFKEVENEMVFDLK